MASVTTPEGNLIHTDGLVRGDTSLEKLARLRPVFAKDGTVTAGNASPLTDGAAAVVLMSEEKARSLGYQPLAAFRSWAYTGVDPADQLLMGPALAMPQALERAGMTLADADLVDMHEAFAAQVLSILYMLGSKAFADEWLGRSSAIGEIDPGAVERARRLGGDRPSLRRDRRPDGAHHGQRALEARRDDGAPRHLRRRRAGGGRGDGAPRLIRAAPRAFRQAP